MPDAGFHFEHARPEIEIKAGILHEIASAAEAAVADSGLPVFQRGGALVRPVSLEVPASRGRTTIASGLHEISVPAMIDTLSQAASWTRYDGRAKKIVPADPPAMVASVLLSRAGQWQQLSSVAGIITAPTLRPDGTILDLQGYDAATRLYHVPEPSLKLPLIPPRPTKEQAAEALEMLLALLPNFPFVSDVDKAVAVSAIITTVVRGALTVVPMHAFRASTAGTGKSFLADTVSSIATGRACPVIAAASSDEETEKRLVGLLLAGFPVISIDNVNGELGGDLLCQAIERPLIRVRPLGRSEIVELESRATIFATGNAFRVRGDMTRRTVISTLDAGMERPETRTFDFDPVETVLANRGCYVAAALTVVRAYIVAGLPGKLPALASFAEWSDLVRSALVWLGCADPCVSMEAAREDDPELAELTEALNAWSLSLGEEGYTLRQVAEVVAESFIDDDGRQAFRFPALRDAMIRLAGERGGIVNTRRLGQWFMNHEGRVVGGLRFHRAGKAQGGVVRWKLSRGRGA